jgi:[acyl-carrier-protein] S-malonyltransferase
MNKAAFLFPGQGAQYPGMGKEFYEAFSIVRETFEEADDLLSENFTQLILEGPQEELTKTSKAQAAIFIVSAALFRCLHAQLPEFKPSLCAGLSLGEYTALFASGRISFAAGLKLVSLRGQYMQEACEETLGGMRVVLGLDEISVAACLPQNVWIANLNCPGQVVIAGLASAMLQAEEALKAQGAKRVLPLEVSGAFHTPLMRSAQEKLKPFLLSAELQESPIELVMNVPGDYVQSLEAVRHHLIAQVASPTRWEKGIRAMQGIETYLEIGPGKTLTGMNRKIGVSGNCLNIETIQDLEKIHEFAQR